MFNFVYVPQSLLLTNADIANLGKGLTANSPDSVLNAEGLFRLRYAKPPVVGQYQTFREVAPLAPIDGIYYNTFEVFDLFTTPQFDPETGQTVSVLEQQQRYDLRRLSELKLQLVDQTQLSYNASIALGYSVTFADNSTAIIPLDSQSNLERLIAERSSGLLKSLQTSEGVKELSSNEFSNITIEAATATTLLNTNLMNQKALIQSFMSSTEAVLFEPSDGFPIHIPPKTINLLVDVDGNEIGYENNQDNESLSNVGMRPAGPSKGYLDLRSVSWLMGVKRIKTINGLPVLQNGLIYEVRDSNNLLAARLTIGFNSTVIECDCIANALPVSIPLVIGF